MMPAANQGVGMNMGFPDVCTTPAAPAPIPIPYPNIGMNAMAMPFVPNVLVSFAPAHNMGAKPMLTNGDNAGVAHPLFMQPGGTLVGNPIILMGGMPANHLGTPSYGNNFNNPVGAKTVPSVTNVMLACTATLDPSAHRTTAQLLQRERSSFERLSHRIAVITLPCISLRGDRWLQHCLRQLVHTGVDRLVIDLRDNPGGSVTTAHRIASALARTGTTIAVAVNQHTASAAELLAALLADEHHASVFGERTYGKGTMSTYWAYHDNLRPSGRHGVIVRSDGAPIHGEGIAPHVACPSAIAVREAAVWLSRRSKQRT